MPDRGRQSTDDSNPFAPPPEGNPDQPWQPRRPAEGGEGSGAPGDGEGGEGGGDGRDGRWSSRWSPRQPGRSSDGFGGEPPRQGRPQPEGPQLRWDPKDPSQRRARYALLAGMWGFFFSVFDFPELGLLLGALAVYWGISSLRGRGRDEPAPAAVRSQTTTAVSGLITGALALVVVATAFAFQLAYRDFYTCVDDALTKDGQVSCNERLPDPLRGLIGVKR
ncbi:hypothetical protein M4914_14580 [Streptomyces somaliensis DSM 40738]|uniref:Integral membrane protein n=1 Tax=Streptomyces somaliensis (strain ATCC 33201 / DSM 40738 / JCM 12659 / KCTC 9044 / NCTC 11332 / NRRL B-12077 / IP 733) TaxID=1134445 RepID=A0AA44DC37_STRE0|nr:hypothetical protein [Streptomyces somaliensis]MCQ0024057.1 hypothetical protein [Streptomyces somaliensis DSM 40738]NKY13909.1 hypothetical protein [Streptomyces somaliensis DSM 40738]